MDGNSHPNPPIAQLELERNPAKVEVAGSSPVGGSNNGQVENLAYRPRLKRGVFVGSNPTLPTNAPTSGLLAPWLRTTDDGFNSYWGCQINKKFIKPSSKFNDFHLKYKG